MIYPGCNKPFSTAFPLSFREPYQAAFLCNLALSAAVATPAIDCTEIGSRTYTEPSFRQWQEVKAFVTPPVVPPHVIDPRPIMWDVATAMRDVPANFPFVDLPSHWLLHIIDQQNYSILDMPQFDFGVGDYANPCTVVAQRLNRNSYC